MKGVPYPVFWQKGSLWQWIALHVKAKIHGLRHCMTSAPTLSQTLKISVLDHISPCFAFLWAAYSHLHASPPPWPPPPLSLAAPSCRLRTALAANRQAWCGSFIENMLTHDLHLMPFEGSHTNYFAVPCIRTSSFRIPLATYSVFFSWSPPNSFKYIIVLSCKSQLHKKRLWSFT